ncbi:MAG TPA: 23S rRNA (pseudouridine(1915)-N(3))-methyltransferase RlmH [Bdellovibrionota bacterium]|nr:23S rRNA (pseudouridine(1915)-N(3))-methyltransferase RlmH [Bdellovibrionota bacterium]
MRVVLACFGKLKTPGLREAADHYLKLARPWIQVEELELKPLPVPDKSPATRKRIQDEEGSLLLSRLEGKLGERGVFFLLDEKGKSMTTADWAAKARSWESESLTGLAFCVGSSLGFSAEVRERSKGSLSLGPQTLAHEVARVVLLEQLYRAWSVVRGHPYHNEGA